jgi:DNA modification methylase
MNIYHLDDIPEDLRGFFKPAPQLGLESTPQEYVAKLVEIFREVRRVLKEDGVLWLNLGDSYAHDNPSGPQGKNGDRSSRTFTAGGAGGKEHGLKPKDLVGIPWRVAFALQAPDYLGTIRNETDRAWMAALIDGEGCITILEATSPHGSGSSYPPILQIRMCDRECIDKAMELTGTGGESPPQYPASMEGQRPAFQWRIHGRKAADTIAEIYPFLLIKRKQAIVAWNHQMVRDGYETKRGVKIPVDALEKQKLCREIIQKLNHREPVDLPCWMIEPPPLIGAGWYLRQDLIWAKPNPMPESVTDRCTKAHEYIFLLSKSASYYYDAGAVAEPCETESVLRDRNAEGYNPSLGDGRDRFSPGARGYGDTRNRRSVWEITTKPYAEAHFATFPPELPRLCIMAGSKPGDTILDPFGGSGTTGEVAQELGRNAVLIELNPAYCELIRTRTAQTGMVL